MSYGFPTTYPYLQSLLSLSASVGYLHAARSTKHFLCRHCLLPVANAGLVILEPLLESQYCGDATHESGARAYVPHFFNVTALVVMSDKQTRDVVLCYKYTAERAYDRSGPGRVHHTIGAYSFVSNVCARTLAKFTWRPFAPGESSMAGK